MTTTPTIDRLAGLLIEAETHSRRSVAEIRITRTGRRALFNELRGNLQQRWLGEVQTGVLLTGIGADHVPDFAPSISDFEGIPLVIVERDPEAPMVIPEDYMVVMLSEEG